MKTISFTLVFFLFFFSFVVLADNKVNPIAVLEPPFPDLYYLFPNSQNPSTTHEPEIMWLRIEEQNLLCNFVFVYPFDSYRIGWSVLRKYSLRDKIYSDPIVLFLADPGKPYWNSANGLVHDASSVTINNKKIYLENSYLREKQNTNNYELEELLVEAYLSINFNFIMGLTFARCYKVINEELYRDIIISFRIWNATNGTEFTEMKQVIGEGYHEIYESPQKRYAMVRFFPLDGERIYIDNEKYTYGPHTLLYDLSNLRMLEVNRDVAFTPDDKYFVTERDGVPTLVLAQTDGNLLRYSIPSPMISATFSPDGQRLYIAGANSKVYVYESGIDSFVREWELMQ